MESVCLTCSLSLIQIFQTPLHSPKPLPEVSPEHRVYSLSTDCWGPTYPHSKKGEKNYITLLELNGITILNVYIPVIYDIKMHINCNVSHMAIYVKNSK